MNTYQWVQPDDVDVLTLQKNNEPIFQITKDGGVYATAALFTSLPLDKELKGGLLTINEHGVLMASPVTLEKISSEINTYMQNTNNTLTKVMDSLKDQVVQNLNKAVDQINKNLLTIQGDMIARSIPEDEMRRLIRLAEEDRQQLKSTSTIKPTYHQLSQDEQVEGMVTEGGIERFEESPSSQSLRKLERMIYLLFILFAILFLLILSVGFVLKSKK